MPVMIHAVTARNGAKARKVKVRVLDFQRIESPFQKFKALLDRVVTLRKLQFATQPVVPERVAYSQHVRVQVGMTGTAAGNGKGKAHQVVPVKSSNSLAADFLADHEHAQRNKIQVAEIPDLFLERHAGIEFIDADAFTNSDLFSSRHGGAQDLGTSSVFACCHNVSISSRVACSSVRPCCRNCSSSQPKRRRNFLLVLRRADSGSTER